MTTTVLRRNLACPVLCAGGRKCVCTQKYPHSLHLCKEPSCDCRKKFRASRGGVQEERREVQG